MIDGEVLGISYTQLIAPTIKAVQEVDKKVDSRYEELTLKIAKLKKE